MGVVESLQLYLRRFSGLWQKFLPMLSLFFCLSFINTILDSLKDTLVITAAGGGAHVIPYLTVYAVLPISFMFLVAYSYASRHLSRAGLFNTIVAAFMLFFGAFTLLLYPNAEALHPHAFADSLSQVRQQQQQQPAAADTGPPPVGEAGYDRKEAHGHVGQQQQLRQQLAASN
jgi:ATP/ADP translocase